MIKSISLFVSASLISISTYSNSLSVGGYIGFGFGQYQEGDKSTESNQSQTYGLTGYYQLNRTQRIGFGFGQMEKTTYSHGTQKLGATLERMLLNSSYEHRFVLSEYIKPYLGVELLISQNEVTDRYLVGGDGYIKSRFENKTSTAFSFNLKASQEMTLGNHFHFEAAGQYEIGENTHNGFSLNLISTYQF